MARAVITSCRVAPSPRPAGSAGYTRRMDTKPEELAQPGRRTGAVQ